MAAARPVVLCILDGWGLGPDPKVSAPAQALVPTFNHLWASCPHATLVTHGPEVGLPKGQMGNSEVGHTNIGAGRVVAMDLGAIDADHLTALHRAPLPANRQGSVRS